MQGNDYVSYVATDNFKAGQLAGEYMAKLLNGRGKVVELRYAEGSCLKSTTKREDGFLDGIQAFEGIKILSSNQYAGKLKFVGPCSQRIVTSQISRTL